MKVNRIELLEQIQSVTSGLSEREIIEQSSSIIFKRGKIYTFNDEIACCQDSVINISGAVKAQSFIGILSRIKDKEIQIGVEGGALLVRGKSKKYSFGLEDIVLPMDNVDTPKKWKRLPEHFTDAVAIVQGSAETHASQFVLTCIHLTPKFMETCDNRQATRYRIKIPIPKNILIKKESLKNIISLDMKSICVTKHWIHFRNTTGLVLSCRKFKDKYPDISDLLDVKGKRFRIPTGLKNLVERAEIFASEGQEESRVIVDLDSKKVQIISKGISGRGIENKKVDEYKGKPIRFEIPSKVLLELISRFIKCTVSSSRIRVKGKNFTYVTAVGLKKKKKKDKKK